MNLEIISQPNQHTGYVAGLNLLHLKSQAAALTT